MNSVKLSEKELTQVINSQELKNDEMENTQKIDLEEINSVSSQETMVAKENLNSLPQNTIVLEKNEEDKK